MWWQKLLVYGCFGILIENFFTGFHTLIFQRNLRCVTQSYLWMLPIYGIGGMGMAVIHEKMQGIAFIVISVVFIYALEFASGWILRKVIGRTPWDYGHARWGIMGLVRLDYLPFWIVVGIGFDSICAYLDRALLIISKL